jgi:hypothetical protein
MFEKTNICKKKRLIEAYIEAIQDTPTHVCAICEKMQFHPNIFNINNVTISSFASLTKDKGSKVIDQNDHICKKCTYQ